MKLSNNLTLEQLLESDWADQFNRAQLSEIRTGLNRNIDVYYADPSIKSDKMKVLRHASENGINLLEYAKDFSAQQLEALLEGAKHNIDYRVYADRKYSHAQMLTIAQGLILNLDVSHYLDHRFDTNQMREILRGLIYKVDVSIFAKLKYSNAQMHIICKELHDCNDVSKLANHKYSAAMMRTLNEILIYKGFDLFKYADEGYTLSQIEAIEHGLKNEVPLELFDSIEFDHLQMKQIIKGYVKGIDVTQYASPDVSWLEMKRIRKTLEKGVKNDDR
jgi:hypothetical protein